MITSLIPLTTLISLTELSKYTLAIPILSEENLTI